MDTGTPHSITSPLNLRQFLRTQPGNGFDFVALLDLAVIGLFLALIGSRFVFAPGAEVELARTTHPELGGPVAPIVLTVGRNDAYFFRGQRILPRDLPAQFSAYVAEHGPESVLLMKLDRSLPLESVFGLIDEARTAGFKRVQIAAESIEERPASVLLP